MSEKPYSFEMPADDLTLVISNDGRFAGDPSREHAYSLWLGQFGRARDRRTYRGDGPDAATWIEASAAGCVGEAMSVLCAPPGALFRICAGSAPAEPAWNMYYVVENDTPSPVRSEQSVGSATDVNTASKGRRIVECHFFDHWMNDGGIAGLRFWSIPFLERLPTAHDRAKRAWDNWTDEDRAAETAAWKEEPLPRSEPPA